MTQAQQPEHVRIKTLEPIVTGGRIAGEGEVLEVTPATARRLIDMGVAVREDGRPDMPFITIAPTRRLWLSDLLGG